MVRSWLKVWSDYVSAAASSFCKFCSVLNSRWDYLFWSHSDSVTSPHQSETPDWWCPSHLQSERSTHGLGSVLLGGSGDHRGAVSSPRCPPCWRAASRLRGRRRANKVSGDLARVTAGLGRDRGVSLQRPRVSTHTQVWAPLQRHTLYPKQVNESGPTDDTEPMTPRKQGGGHRKGLVQIHLVHFRTSFVFKSCKNNCFTKNYRSHNSAEYPGHFEH